MEPALRIKPDRETFSALAREWPLVPMWAELLADVSTPVGLFPAARGRGPGDPAGVGRALANDGGATRSWRATPPRSWWPTTPGVHVQDLVREGFPIGDPLAAARAARGPEGGRAGPARPAGRRPAAAHGRADGLPGVRGRRAARGPPRPRSGRGALSADRAAGHRSGGRVRPLATAAAPGGPRAPRSLRRRGRRRWSRWPRRWPRRCRRPLRRAPRAAARSTPASPT